MKNNKGRETLQIMGMHLYEGKQFTQDELEVINEALIFTVNCLEREEAQLCNRIKLVFAKTTSLLKES
ncbi:MAG TPA: hypothetical protein VH796_08700 [Nitrososphaeraceae archaeon]